MGSQASDLGQSRATAAWFPGYPQRFAPPAKPGIECHSFFCFPIVTLNVVPSPLETSTVARSCPKEAIVIQREGRQGAEEQPDAYPGLGHVGRETRVPIAIFLFAGELECQPATHVDRALARDLTVGRRLYRP